MTIRKNKINNVYPVKMRYSRQISLPEYGHKGQEILGKKTVAIIGVGGLGCVCAQLLCRSGIGKIILIDHDTVDITNLHRQSLYTEKDVGRNKVMSAADHLKEINSDVAIVAIDGVLDSTTIEKIMSTAHVDILLDCTDNLPVRFIINTYCSKNKIPWVHASVVKNIGRVKFFRPGKACYECIYGNRKETERPTITGVHNTAIFMVASLETTLALQALFNNKPDERLLHIDAWNMTIEKINVKKNPGCKNCQCIFKYF